MSAETPAHRIAAERALADAWLGDAAARAGVAIEEAARATCAAWLGERLAAIVAQLPADSSLDDAPVARALIAGAVAAWRRRTGDLFAHLARDAHELGGCRTIAAMQPHGEGLHARATTVGLVLADGSRWFHRTRDRRMAAWFQDVCAALGAAGLAPTLHVRRILVRDGCSWDEGVVPALATEPAAIRRYFVRAGMLVRLLERFAAVDFHARNVVAAGELPVLVDVETLFVPAPSGGAALEALVCSPLRAGLISLSIVGAPGRQGIDGCGLHPGGEVRPPFDEDGRPVVETLAPTIPAPLGDHVDDLLAGWDAMEDVLARTDLAPLLARVPALPRRELRGNGRLYHQLLEASLAPALLRSDDARDRWLAQHDLSPDERAALRALELPRPMVPVGAHPALAREPPLSIGARARRHDLIRSVIALRDDRPARAAVRPLAASRAAIAVELGDRLLALQFADGTWHGTRWFPAHGLRLVGVLAGDLHGGTAGLAIVLAMLGRASGQARFAAGARAALATLPDARPSVGAFGLGGAIYALACCAELLADAALAARARELVAAAPRPAAPWNIGDGVAGFVLAALATGDVPAAAVAALHAAWTGEAAASSDAAPWTREAAASSDAAAWSVADLAPAALAGGLPPCLPLPRAGIAHALARAGAIAEPVAWRPAIASELDAVDEALLAIRAGDATRARDLRACADALVERRRATGHWFPATSVAERHQTSLVDGLPAVIHALLAADDPELRAIRRMA